MNFESLNIDLLKQYKKTIIEYIKEVLYTNGLDSSLEEINRIYNNMCKFSQEGSAIIIGALEDNKLMGVIWAYEIEKNREKRIHITQFIINHSVRGKGIGQKLIEIIYDIAKQRGIKYIELMATYRNKKTMKFYEKQEFDIERVQLCKKIS